MAEVQKTTHAGESTAQFIEFVMLQAQNASLFLGLIAHPENGQPEVNLPLARMFIDHLNMLQDKTRGNLSSEESNVLRNALSNLQMAYVEVAQGQGAAAPAASAPKSAALETESAANPQPLAPQPSAEAETPPASPPDESREGRKRFTKSYGS